jgi:transcriptional regulator with XRE-family HTH domain
MTNFELIQRAAAVLYGDRQSAMAHDLGVTTRTVYRWLHGRATPTLKIFVTLLERLHTHLDELDSLGATIKEYLKRNAPTRIQVDGVSYEVDYSVVLFAREPERRSQLHTAVRGSRKARSTRSGSRAASSTTLSTGKLSKP